MPEILTPSLYQEVLGVGLPVVEQLNVRLPDDLAATMAGGMDFRRTNSSPPYAGPRP